MWRAKTCTLNGCLYFSEKNETKSICDKYYFNKQNLSKLIASIHKMNVLQIAVLTNKWDYISSSTVLIH